MMQHPCAVYIAGKATALTGETWSIPVQVKDAAGETVGTVQTVTVKLIPGRETACIADFLHRLELAKHNVVAAAYNGDLTALLADVAGQGVALC